MTDIPIGVGLHYQPQLSFWHMRQWQVPEIVEALYISTYPLHSGRRLAHKTRGNLLPKRSVPLASISATFLPCIRAIYSNGTAGQDIAHNQNSQQSSAMKSFIDTSLCTLARIFTALYNTVNPRIDLLPMLGLLDKLAAEVGSTLFT